MKQYLINGFTGAFEPEDVELLGVALTSAWKTVQDSGAYLDGNAENVREVLAKHIIEEAMAGERDVRELCGRALGHLARNLGDFGLQWNFTKQHSNEPLS